MKSHDVNKFSIVFFSVALVLLGISLLFRMIYLENIPGINGDEAWYGCQVMGFLQGGDYTCFHVVHRPINPFYSGILLVLHLFFAPDFWVLRMPALISGILLLPLAFYFFYKIYSPFTAITCTLFLAVLPINIAYSRFGWEPSQIPIACLVPLYLGWQKHWKSAFFSFFCAIWIHPTCLFLLPILLGMLVLPMVMKKKKLPLLRLAIIGAFAMGLGLSFAYFVPIVRTKFKLDLFLYRLTSLTHWQYYILYFGHLFSGITVYQYMAGPPSGMGLHFLLFWMVFLYLISFGSAGLYARKNWQALGMLLGLLVALFAHFIFAGPGGLMPGYERYGLFLVVPVVMSLGFCLETQVKRKKRMAGIVSLLLAGLLLFSFYENYFIKIQTTGGQTEKTFYTAKIEPKKQAFSLVVSRKEKGRPLRIVTENWWLYWPLKYLAFQRKDIEVTWLKIRKKKDFSRFLFLLKKGAYAIGFTRGPFQRTMGSTLRKFSFRQWKIQNFSQKAILLIWQMER